MVIDLDYVEAGHGGDDAGELLDGLEQKALAFLERLQ